MGMRISRELEASIMATHGVKVTQVQPPVVPGEPGGGSPDDERQSEKEFQAAVVKEALRRGWLAYHTYDSRKCTAGFPDLVLVRNRVLWLELKTETGVVTPEQEEWLSRLRAAGEFAFVLRPRDWPFIVEVLA